MNGTRNYWPGLLTRQMLLLSAIAGIFASRHFHPALIALLLLMLHGHQRIFRHGIPRAIGLVILMFICFGSACIYARERAPVLPPFPAWLQEAASPTIHDAALAEAQGKFFRRAGEKLTGKQALPGWWNVADNALPDELGESRAAFKTGLRVRATVREAQGQSDRNLRIILDGIRPVTAETSREGNAGLIGAMGQSPARPPEAWGTASASDVFNGHISFTWNNPLTPEAPATPGRRMYGNGRQEARSAILPRRPAAGDEVELTLRPRLVRSLQNPGLWESEAYWADRGVWARAWATGSQPDLRIAADCASESLFSAGIARKAALWRENLRMRVSAALPREDGTVINGAGLIPALLFGDKYLMDGTDAELLSSSTLAHSLALSGLHLGYAAALGYFFMLLVYRICPTLALRLPRQKAAVAAGLLPASLYLWLGGCPPSLLRSYLMFVFIGILICMSRPKFLGDALIWAVTLILLAAPAALFDLRLQLSAMCIAALALLLPASELIRDLLCKAKEKTVVKPEAVHPRMPHGAKPHSATRFLRYIPALLLTSAVIQLALAPLLVKTFGTVGLAIPLNAIWLPILGAVVMPFAFLGLFMSALGLPSLASALFYIAALPCGWLMQALRFLAENEMLPVFLPPRPHWFFMLGYWFLLSLVPVILASVFAACRSPRAKIPAHVPFITDGAIVGLKICCGFLLLAAPFIWQHTLDARDTVRLKLMDVGHGQAVLIEWKGGKRLLLDGGGTASPSFDIGKEIITAELTNNRMPHLDYMLASHLDLDHARGLLFPLRHLNVRCYADNGQSADKTFAREMMRLLDQKKLERHTLAAKDALDLGNGLILEIVHPVSPGNSGNNNSLVARLLWRGKGLALLCGDVEKAGQKNLLKRLAGQNSLDALKAAILVIPHHGSGNALLPEFYQAVSPRLALVSSAYGNTWNFPSAAVKNTLLEQGIPLLNTARIGQIQVEWNNPDGLPKITGARTGPLHTPQD